MAADGNCLFRSLAGQLALRAPGGGGGRPPAADHVTLRTRAAEYIASHAADFAP
jgi:hypothetical protein